MPGVASLAPQLIRAMMNIRISLADVWQGTLKYTLLRVCLKKLNLLKTNHLRFGKTYYRWNNKKSGFQDKSPVNILTSPEIIKRTDDVHKLLPAHMQVPLRCFDIKMT